MWQCTDPWIHHEHTSLARVASWEMRQVLQLGLQLLDLPLALKDDLRLVTGRRRLASIAGRLPLPPHVFRRDASSSSSTTLKVDGRHRPPPVMLLVHSVLGVLPLLPGPLTALRLLRLARAVPVLRSNVHDL